MVSRMGHTSVVQCNSGHWLDPPPGWEGVGRYWEKGGGRGQGPLKAESARSGSTGAQPQRQAGLAPTTPPPCYGGPSVAGSRLPRGMWAELTAARCSEPQEA
jgi:hypothetical protein